MTFRDFLANAAGLTRDERQAVYQSVTEKGFDPDPLEIVKGRDEVPPHLKAVVDALGSEVTYWKPDLDEEGWKAALTALQDMKNQP